MAQQIRSDAPQSTQSKSCSKPGKYSPEEIQKFVQQFQKDGYVILKNHFCPEKLENWRKTFLKILDERIKNGTASGRGPARYYCSLPFEEPFADPDIYEDPDVLAILRGVTDGDLVMPELATDTPFNGSEYQVIHRDHPQKSPDLPELDPKEPFQFGVNFALSPVTRENGPFEIAPGTHSITDEESKEMIRSGAAEKALIPLMMEVGDVMVRDVRALHRGTPNKTDEPRVMVVVGYNRRRHRRPQLRIHIPRATFDTLSEQAKTMLNVNPVVESLKDVKIEEAYSNLYFLEEDEKK